jgi:excisionase family DNA binding protein
MEKLFSTKEAAEYLKVTPGTVENWRYAGTGPKFTKPGGRGRIYYTETSLKEWIETGQT